MARFAPQFRLGTHDVTNQPPDLTDVNLWGADTALREAALRESGDWLDPLLTALGADCGSAHVLEWGVLANQHPPELAAFDRQGRRIDEVRFHPAWHELMDLAMRHRIHAIAWTANRPGGHVAHAAMLAVFTQAEAGAMCPVSMTSASVPVLRREQALATNWLPKVLHGGYDEGFRPIAEKTGVTLGMAMTEKQGGSDVRANATRAEPISGRGPGQAYMLDGHKWFCSAPMSDGFLTLAQAEGGLSCFLVPRITPEGERNAIHLLRLKDKLGNRSNASAEIEYHGAQAVLVGEEGRGVNVIIDMVHETRLGAAAAALGIMRGALAQAAHHVAHRHAFQRTLIDQPAMQGVIADLQVEYEAAATLAMRAARAFDGESEDERGFARLAVALAKYWINKRCPGFVAECLECLGGGGYVEESPMPRLYREAPLNGIWEGSGNVIALDIQRTLGKVPAALDALRGEIAEARDDGRIAAALADLDTLLRDNAGREEQARFIAERLAVTLQAALLVRCGPAAVADAFCATRLRGEGGRAYGTLPRGLGTAAIIARTGATQRG